MEKVSKIGLGDFNMFKFELENKCCAHITELLQLPGERYRACYTKAAINEAQPLEIYKDTIEGIDYHYIVIRPINKKFALCYSIHPI